MLKGQYFFLCLYLNLTLPGPTYNQPSHEIKCESMLITFYIALVVKDLKNFTKWNVKLQKIIK